MCSALFHRLLAWLIEGNLSKAVILMNYDKPFACRQADVPAFLLYDRNLMEDAQMGKLSDGTPEVLGPFLT